MNEVSVKTKIAEPLRFLKKSKNVFDSFKELNGRKSKYIDGHYTWSDKSYTRSEIIPDYLLLLNINKNPSSGHSIGISITYKGLDEENSYFIASVADFEVKKNEFGYSSNEYLSGSNIEQSCKMNYAEFSEKLRIFNKKIRNMLDVKDVIEEFSNIMGVSDKNNIENKKKQQDILTEKYHTLNENLESGKNKEIKLSKKIEKASKKFEDENEITDMKKEEKELMDQLRILRVKIDKKNKEKKELLNPLMDELNIIHKENELEEQNIENIKREAKNTLGSSSFLK